MHKTLLSPSTFWPDAILINHRLLTSITPLWQQQVRPMASTESYHAGKYTGTINKSGRRKDALDRAHSGLIYPTSRQGARWIIPTCEAPHDLTFCTPHAAQTMPQLLDTSLSLGRDHAHELYSGCQGRCKTQEHPPRNPLNCTTLG